MNEIYPYNTPIIMTESIFQQYGGDINGSTPEMRQIAYVIAEEAVTDDVGTFLLPTTITGTYSYNLIRPLITEYAYVNSVNLVQFLDVKDEVYYSVTGTNNVYVSIRDDTYGIIDVHYLLLNCQCVSSWNPYPYKINVSYTAGLPTGISSNPKFLLALTTYTDMVLNQIEGYGNEADGLVGVSEFKNQDYSEKRHNLKRTIFGSSARAQFVSDLLTRYRKHRFVGL
ncbi:hypothetical protein KA005_02550 [bacterium]|nr:hypothetical protein [bacterium]